MSVLLELGEVGDIVIDLLTDQAPRTCENFLKLYVTSLLNTERTIYVTLCSKKASYCKKQKQMRLIKSRCRCKVKYYNFSPIYGVQKDFSFQTGDPIGPDSPDSDGGTSIWGLLGGPSKRFFPAEFHPKLKHSERGTVSMATAPAASNPDERVSGSQFIITTGDNLDYLDGKASIFGKVVEGFDVLEKINNSFCDKNGRPLKDIRIRHTIILEDPYPDPEGLVEPSQSPVPSAAQLATVRIGEDEELNPDEDPEVAERRRREREAKAQALTLEMVGDLPFADVKPPENVLFVCKLNPVTQGKPFHALAL